MDGNRVNQELVRSVVSSASVRVAKQILYRYSGDPHSDETIIDRNGEIPIPVKHEVLKRHSKKWKVVAVETLDSVAGPKTVPTYLVYLTDSF